MAKNEPKPKTLVVPFPLKGKDVNWSRVDQPPLTTPDCLNVWAYDRYNRSRGAQRPGFTRMWAESVDNDVLYYQCKRCTDDTLVDLYVKASEITPTYRFKWSGDFNCYYVTSTNPKTFAPGVVAYSGSRTSVATCADVSCGSEYNPPNYRRARKCTDGSLANLYVPEAEISAFPYYFLFAGDGNCYQVLSTDAATITPGLIAPTASRTSKASCSASGCGCSTCAVTPADFTWDTGTVQEHIYGGSPNFIRNSPEFSVCSASEDGIIFSAISDDFVILTKSTDSVTQTYSGTAGDTPTFTLPAAHVIFRNTFGHTRYTNTVEKIFTDGTSTFTLPAGTAGIGEGDVVDMEADGFLTRTWGSPITWTEMTALGWIDGDGIARLKFWHVVSGNGRCQIISADCHTGGGVTMYSTGEDWMSGVDCPTDDRWSARSATAYIGTPPEPWATPPAGSDWISIRCDMNGEGITDDSTGEYVTSIYIDTDVDIPTLEIPFEAAADDSASIWIRNGSGDTDTGLTIGGYNPTTVDTLTGAMGFEVGDNQLVVKVYNFVTFEGLVFKFGNPTWTP